ncbi:MAG TPA: YbhB/YbcL family Raf kinase inhibitor-like protein [Streptosporangiaceae bacterium]|nr:YbhB/YbcL family Raf kinase inhibitor-like protein [Streptosporangiaceae bacterium]
MSSRALSRHAPRTRGVVRDACRVAVTMATAGGLAACGLTQSTTDVGEWFTVTSAAFREGGQIPVRFGCSSYRGGEGRTPPLHWSGGPQPPATQAYAIVVDDPDAPNGSYVHWVIADIDGTTADLVEGAHPEGAVEAINTSGTPRYQPPCPPKGQVHRYRFTIYALSEKLPLRQGAELNDALNEIAKHTIGRGRLTGMFGTK